MSTYFVKLLGARSVRLRVDDGEMLVIGRADEADLQLEDKLVSRQHCEIEVRSGSLIVRDLGSRNGTVLNGRRFAGERVAHPGDQVKVGSHFLLIERNLDSGFHESREQSEGSRRRSGSDARYPSIPGYEVIKMLGRGQTGKVYRGRSLIDQREVAIKVLGTTSDETTVLRFQRSAHALMRLDHPNIVTVESVDSIGDQHFYVMEHLRGKQLDELAQNGGLGVREALSIMVQVARALKLVHEHDIIHRDVSPENILVLRGGTVRLIGFGYVKERKSDTPSLTALDEIVGELAYSSPEQVKDPRDVDSRSDIYSLGAVLFYALVGRPPYEGRNHLELIRKVMRGDAPQIRSIDPSLPLPLDDLVAAMLEKDPGERPQSAGEVEEKLEDALLIVCGAEHERTSAEKSFGGGFSGSELLEIVQFLELHKKSGRLIISAGALEGELGLKGGAITSAIAGHLEGETAVTMLLSASEGTFRFRPLAEGERAPDTGIKLSPSVVALHVLRRRDEARR